MFFETINSLAATFKYEEILLLQAADFPIAFAIAIFVLQSTIGFLVS